MADIGFLQARRRIMPQLAWYTRYSVAASALLFLASCSLAPITPRVQAEPLGKGNVQVDTWVVPTLAVSAMYGVTEKLDIGLDLEQGDQVNLWSRYNLIHGPTLSLAATGGIFAKQNENDASGYFMGAILNGKVNDDLQFFTSYRLSQVNYSAVDMGQPFLTDDELYSIDSRNSTDLSSTSQFQLGLLLKLPSKATINLGLGCQYHHRNNDPDISTQICGPLIGLSLLTGR